MDATKLPGMGLRRCAALALAACSTLGSGHAAGRQVPELRPAESDAERSPVLTPDRCAAKVRGKTVDEQGRPIEGVDLVLPNQGGRASIACRSGAAGEFAVELEWSKSDPGTFVRIAARKVGYARADYEALEWLRPGQDLDVGKLTLKPGGAVAGTVRTLTGEALPAVRVVAVRAETPPQPPAARSEQGPPESKQVDSCEGDTQGQFELVGLPTGRWVLWAKHDSTYWRSTGVVEVAAGQRALMDPISLEPLPPEWCIEGIVVDPDGNSVSGVRVSSAIDGYGEYGTYFPFQTYSDTAGRFRLFLPQLQERALDLDGWLDGDLYERAELTGVAPGSRDVRLQLGAMRSIQVEVVDTAGQPVETFGWSLTKILEYGMQTWGEATGNHPSGRATVRVPLGSIELQVDSDGHRSPDAQSVPRDPSSVSMRFVLEPLAAVTGQVLSRGQPVPRATVELATREPNYLGDSLLPGYWSGLHYGLRGEEVIADELGRFRLPSDFPRIEYYAHAWAPGFAEGFSPRAFVGGDPVVVELAPASAIEGSVVVPPGADPAGIEIELFRKDHDPGDMNSSLGHVFRTTVDAEARWRIDSLAAGPWLARVRIPGTLAGDLGWDRERLERNLTTPWLFVAPEGAAGNAVIDLREESFCTLEGRLTIGDLIREGYVKLLLEPPLGLQAAFAEIEEDGSFTMRTRQPGRYRLYVQGGSGHYLMTDPVTDVVELKLGTTEWIHEFAPDQLTGGGIRLDKP